MYILLQKREKVWIMTVHLSMVSSISKAYWASISIHRLQIAKENKLEGYFRINDKKKQLNMKFLHHHILSPKQITDRNEIGQKINFSPFSFLVFVQLSSYFFTLVRLRKTKWNSTQAKNKEQQQERERWRYAPLLLEKDSENLRCIWGRVPFLKKGVVGEKDTLWKEAQKSHP